MWIDNAGFLYMPAAQLDKTSANFAGGPGSDSLSRKDLEDADQPEAIAARP